MNTTHGERDRIADGRLLAGQPDLGLEQQDLDRIAVERQRHLQVSALAEQDQANTVAFATTDEIARDGFRGGQAIDAAPAEFEILLVHTAGQIDGEHQVTTGNRHVEFIANALGPRCGQDEQAPGEHGHPESPVEHLLGGGTVSQRLETGQAGHTQAGLGQATRFWQKLAYEPRKRQREQCPGPGQRPHQAAPRRGVPSRKRTASINAPTSTSEWSSSGRR